MMQMALPKIDGFFRTGLANVASSGTTAQDNFLFDAEMVRGSKLLSSLSKIDYIKCDVEGYEKYIIPELKPIFEKYKPTLQKESADQVEVRDLLKGLGYKRFGLINGLLQQDPTDEEIKGDHLFIHSSRLNAYNPILFKK